MKSRKKFLMQRTAAFPRRGERAITLLEVLVVILVVIILVGLIWPFGEPSAKPKAIRIRCLSNLKQVGLAFSVWGQDHEDNFPMAVYTNKSGRPLYDNSANLFRYFQVMSNELSNPNILICPDDRSRRAATNFTTDFNSSHLSYFLGLNADEIHSNAFLCGDSNITNGLASKNAVLELTTNQSVAWTMDRHGGAGNVCLADGSVQQFSSLALRNALKQTGLATNLLLMPDKKSAK